MLLGVLFQLVELEVDYKRIGIKNRPLNVDSDSSTGKGRSRLASSGQLLWLRYILRMWQDQDLFPAAAYEDRWWKRSISAAKLSSGGGIAIYFLLFLVARRLSQSIFCRPPHTGTSAIYWVFSLFIYLGYYFPTIIILATYRFYTLISLSLQMSVNLLRPYHAFVTKVTNIFSFLYLLS